MPNHITAQTLLSNVLLSHSPGFLGLLDLNSKLILVNKAGLNWIGFESIDAVAGISYYDLRCRAVEDAPIFLHQDLLVKTSYEAIEFVGHYCYADNDWKIILGKKYLVNDNCGQPMGIVSQFDNVTDYRILDVSRFLIKSSQRFEVKKQFCSLLQESYPNSHLSERESECLFFMLRGKTTKSIAKLLKLSPRTIESYIEQIKFKMEVKGSTIGF